MKRRILKHSVKRNPVCRLKRTGGREEPQVLSWLQSPGSLLLPCLTPHPNFSFPTNTEPLGGLNEE